MVRAGQGCQFKYLRVGQVLGGREGVGRCGVTDSCDAGALLQVDTSLINITTIQEMEID